MDASTAGEPQRDQGPSARGILLAILVVATITLTVLAGIFGGWALALVVPAAVFTLAMAINVVLRLSKQSGREQK